MIFSIALLTTLVTLRVDRPVSMATISIRSCLKRVCLSSPPCDTLSPSESVPAAPKPLKKRQKPGPAGRTVCFKQRCPIVLHRESERRLRAAGNILWSCFVKWIKVPEFLGVVVQLQAREEQFKGRKKTQKHNKNTKKHRKKHKSERTKTLQFTTPT